MGLYYLLHICILVVKADCIYFLFPLAAKHCNLLNARQHHSQKLENCQLS